MCQSRFKRRGFDLGREGEVFERIVTQKALSINIPVLGENPLRAIQDCESAHSAWIKLHPRYAGKPAINKLSALNNPLNYKY